MNKIIYLLTVILCSFLYQSVQAIEPVKSTQNPNPNRLSPEAALLKLLEGNKRYMADKNISPGRDQIRREATTGNQEPFGIILGCSDSRVPPEIAFDQGIGDLFVVRIAGNVVSLLEMESIEYSALVNHSSIILVLGHKNCGAVSAVMQGQTEGISGIADLIKPAVMEAKQNKQSLDAAIIDNVKNSVARIKKSPAIMQLMQTGKIDVVGGYYDLATGLVEIVSESEVKFE